MLRPWCRNGTPMHSAAASMMSSAVISDTASFGIDGLRRHVSEAAEVDPVCPLVWQSSISLLRQPGMSAKVPTVTA